MLFLITLLSLEVLKSENERIGRFVAMPSRRLKQEKKAYRDLCHPLNQETRELLTKAIFEAYDVLEETE